MRRVRPVRTYTETMKRTRFLLTKLAAAAAFVLAPLAAIGQDPSISLERKGEVLDAMGKIIESVVYVPGVDFSKWKEFQAKHREKMDVAKTESEFAEAVNGALHEFGFSHIVLATPRSARARVERKVVGIGIMVQHEEEGLRVINVFPQTPAEEIGLQPGDLIVEADGKKYVPGMSLVGEEGTEVSFTILREAERKAYTVKRRKYSNIRKDTISWPNPETAHIIIHTFDLSYDRRRVDELMEEASRAKNVILDLRGNGGGVVLNMLHLLSHFLPSDAVIGTFINRAMVRDYVKETGGKQTDLKAIAEWAESSKLKPLRNRGKQFEGNVAVLINGGSGSASEITAAALKEHRNCPIVGTKSAGAVLVSMMSPLPGGFSLQYPLMDYVTYKGIRLEGNGIVPDAESPAPKFKEPDTAIEKALALIAKMQMQKPPKAA
jgi:carboxyl-terminal processing protease